MTVLVDLVRMRLDVGGDFGLQRRREHLAGTIANDLIQQRRPKRRVVLVWLCGIVDYREHGRAFPNQRSNAGPDQSFLDFRSSSGRCAPSRHQAEDHPQVLIIAPWQEVEADGWVPWVAERDGARTVIDTTFAEQALRQALIHLSLP